MTKAIQHNPFIQEVKLNEKNMTRRAKNLMKSELAKNREIQRYGANTAADENEIKTMKTLDLKE